MKTKVNLFRSSAATLVLGVAALSLPSLSHAAPYTLELTSVGDGANNGSVYFDPYVGTIKQGSTTIYSGYLICDDYNTESYVSDPWGAVATPVWQLNGNEKFKGESYAVGGTTYDTQQMYSAAAYLANELLQPSNVTNATTQGTLSFAIWDIMDGTSATGAVQGDIETAFNNVSAGYEGSNVEVYTPNPLNASQEFLVVNVPEPMSLVLFGVGLAGVGLARRTRKAKS